MTLRIPEEQMKRSEAIDERYGDFRIEDAEYRNSHLWLVEVEDDGTASEPERLTEGDFHVADIAWSPDGTRIAVTRQPTSQLLSFMDSDVWTLDVESGEMTAVAAGEGPDGSPEWSPDGEWILFSEYRGDLGSLFYRNGQLARVPADGGEIEILTGDFDEEPGGATWTEAGIRFWASRRTERFLYALDPAAGEIQRLETPGPVVGSYDFSSDGRTLALVASGPESLGEVYLQDRSGGATRLTDVTARVDFPVGSREVITWESEDGTEIEGVLYRPADYDPDRAYPLLVQIHGGPTGTSRPVMLPRYVYPIVHWLEKGALVLQPNYRGSAGYGEDFRSLNVRNLGVGDAWDVMSGVRHLVDRGVAHPDSLGAMGWSQGGYISAFLTTNTDAFRAISVGAGISNWTTYYVNTDIHPFTRQYLKTTPWEGPEIYARTSPITNVTEASTPTLIQHGENDARVPIPNAYELYQGLKDQGVETKLVVYERFGHGISRPKERLAATWHNWQWFARHVWGEDVELPVKVETEDDAEAREGGRL
jgi:dipeptidyl aminopeptidase/acylaminoacyl peptidase